jgi:hypothetical protein
MTSDTVIVRWPGGDSRHTILPDLCSTDRYVVMVETELIMKPMSVPVDWVDEIKEP